MRDFRSAEGLGPRHCQGFRGQGFRAEPAAEDISASAAADCRPGAQAGADALTMPGVGYLTALAFMARRRPSRTRRLVGADRDAVHGYLRPVGSAKRSARGG